MEEQAEPIPEHSGTGATEDGRSWGTIAILVILLLLLGLAFLAYQRVSNLIAKTAAQKICVELAGGITSYHFDYERYPLSGVAAVTKDREFLTDGADEFILVLVALGNPAENSKHINFLDGMARAKTIGGKLAGGLEISPFRTFAQVLDHWGRPYRVILDTNDDHEFDNPEFTTLTPGGPPAKLKGKRALIYSAGPDGDYSTWNDNPKSW